jgi:hypothetical protein
MTLTEIHEKVQEIFFARFDDEKAHALEDQLHTDVLVAIANGADNGAELAMAALHSRTVEFSRWIA